MIHEELTITVEGIEAAATLTTYLLSQYEDVRMEPDYTLFFREVPMGQGGINIRHLIEAGEKLDPGMPFIIEHLDSEEAYLESIRYAQSLMNSSLGRNAENKQKGEQP